MVGPRRGNTQMKSLMRSASLIAAIALMTGSAAAEPAKPKRPVALFLDLSEDRVPAAIDLQAKTFDLNGLPVRVGTGPSSDFGLRTGDGLDLGGGFSLDGAASLSRRLAPGAVFAGMGEMSTGATARFQQSGWDIAVFPELGTTRLGAGHLPNFALGGSVARGGGWAWDATSRYEVRRTDALAGEAGSTARGQLGLSKLPLWGAALDLGYFYNWTEPKSETASLSQGPSIALDLGLADALNCRVGYRYAFAGDLGSDGPGFAWLGDGGQDLTVGWDWDLAAEGMRATTFSAAFTYHQDFFATAAPWESSGSLNFATAF
jgi:hypothetical protein